MLPKLFHITIYGSLESLITIVTHHSVSFPLAFRWGGGRGVMTTATPSHCSSLRPFNEIFKSTYYGGTLARWTGLLVKFLLHPLHPLKFDEPPKKMIHHSTSAEKVVQSPGKFERQWRPV